MSVPSPMPVHYSVSWQCELVPEAPGDPSGIGRARVVVSFDSLPVGPDVDVYGTVTGELDLVDRAGLPIVHGVCRAWTLHPGCLTLELRMEARLSDDRLVEVRVSPQRDDCSEPAGMEPAWFDVRQGDRRVARGRIEFFLRHFLMRALEAA